MKPSAIYLLSNDEADGPHEVSDIFLKIEEGLSEETLSSIEGMKGWRCLSETLVYAYAKLLPGLPQAAEWIEKMADSSLNLRDGNLEIRRTLLRTINLDDHQSPKYLWPALDANARLLRSLQDYNQREQHWNEFAMEAYPILEFKPFAKPPEGRDWLADWQIAGGTYCQGRMLARIDDPCWKKLSDFNLPFTPFSFGRDGCLAGVALAQAKSLGLVFDVGPVRLPPLPPFQMVGL